MRHYFLQKTLKLLVKRYLKTKHKIDIAELENEGTKQPSLKENIEFEASVRSFIDQLRKNKRGFPQKMRSFEVRQHNPQSTYQSSS